MNGPIVVIAGLTICGLGTLIFALGVLVVCYGWRL